MEDKGDLKPESTLDDVKGYMTTLHTVAVVKVVIGVLCLLFGITTIVLTTPASGPFSSGSGISCGVVAILAGIFEMFLVKDATSTSPRKLKCLLLSVRVLMVVGFHFGCLSLANGVWALVVCAQGSKEKSCGGVHWSANIVVAASNVTLGLTILVLFILTIRLYVKMARTLWNMTKVHNGKTTEVA